MAEGPQEKGVLDINIGCRVSQIGKANIAWSFILAEDGKVFRVEIVDILFANLRNGNNFTFATRICIALIYLPMKTLT